MTAQPTTAQAAEAAFFGSLGFPVGVLCRALRRGAVGGWL
jgi:hypothetical protein